jgi:hypothetical protein
MTKLGLAWTRQHLEWLTEHGTNSGIFHRNSIEWALRWPEDSMADTLAAKSDSSAIIRHETRALPQGYTSYCVLTYDAKRSRVSVATQHNPRGPEENGKVTLRQKIAVAPAPKRGSGKPRVSATHGHVIF